MAIGHKLRFQILQRDNYKCRLCNRSASDGARLEVDHIIPSSKGGTDDLTNLWALCYECNQGKRDLYIYDSPPSPMLNKDSANKKRARLMIALTPKLYEQLAIQAKRENRTASNLAVKTIMDYLKNQTSVTTAGEAHEE